MRTIAALLAAAALVLGTGCTIDLRTAVHVEIRRACRCGCQAPACHCPPT